MDTAITCILNIRSDVKVIVTKKWYAILRHKFGITTS